MFVISVKLKNKLNCNFFKDKINTFEFCYNLTSHLGKHANCVELYKQAPFHILKYLQETKYFCDDLIFKSNVPKLKEVIIKLLTFKRLNSFCVSFEYDCIYNIIGSKN